MDRLQRAATSSVARRKTNHALLIGLVMILFLNLIGWAAVALTLHLQVQNNDHRDKREKLTDTRYTDMAKSLNALQEKLAKIDPGPPPAVIINTSPTTAPAPLPSTTTTRQSTVGTSTPVTRPTTSTSAPPTPTSTSSTTAPPPPPPSSTCPTILVVEVCRAR